MTLIQSLREHWPEYLIEAWGLGTFMILAGLIVSVLHAPCSPGVLLIETPILRQALTGLLIGLTAIALIYSPWGQRSGAHMNPAVTLTFLRLGKIAPWDALFFIVAQVLGGLLGVFVITKLMGPSFSEPPVRYIATVPGAAGATVAFLAEVVISCGLMATVLAVSNIPDTARLTGICAGVLVATYIFFETPLSGMSMNPARSLATALIGNIWTQFWIYCTAPLLGMLSAAELYCRWLGGKKFSAPRWITQPMSNVFIADIVGVAQPIVQPV